MSYNTSNCNHPAPPPWLARVAIVLATGAAASCTRAPANTDNRPAAEKQEPDHQGERFAPLVVYLDETNIGTFEGATFNPPGPTATKEHPGVGQRRRQGKELFSWLATLTSEPFIDVEARDASGRRLFLSKTQSDRRWVVAASRRGRIQLFSYRTEGAPGGKRLPLRPTRGRIDKPALDNLTTVLLHTIAVPHRAPPPAKSAASTGGSNTDGQGTGGGKRDGTGGGPGGR